LACWAATQLLPTPCCSATGRHHRCFALRRAGDGPTHSGESSDSLLEELGVKADASSGSGSSSSSSDSEAERRRRKVWVPAV
jgi:hypothetical protein